MTIIYFEYDTSGNTIIGLTTDGKKEESIIIPRLNENDNTTLITAIGNGINSILQDSDVKNVNFAPDSGVININKSAFNTASNLTTFDLSNNQSLKSIGDNAFVNCSNLTTFNLPNSSILETIGVSAFVGCISLTKFDLLNNESLKTISNNAFENCTSLTTFNLSSNKLLETIGNSAFRNCFLLNKIDLSSNISSLKTIDEGAFIDCVFLKIDISNNESLEKIGSGAFFNCLSLNKFDLSNNKSLKIIGNNAFVNCTSLKSIFIPNTVNNIGQNVFENTQLISISTNISNGSSYFYIHNFNNANILYTSNRLIHSTINIIGEYTILSGTFNNIEINVNQIDNYAFEFCNNLSSIILPTTLENFGNNPFINCLNLSSITTYEGNTSLYFYIHNSNGGNILYTSDRLICSTINITGEYTILTNSNSNIQINNKILDTKNIDDFAFSNCKYLSSIILPTTLTDIGQNPFANCINLNNISTSNQNTSDYFYIHNSNEGNILYTSDRLICSTVNITGEYNILTKTNSNIIINNEKNTQIDTQIIDDYAFSNCTNLKSIILPITLKDIGLNPFRGCINLTNISTIEFNSSKYFYIHNSNNGNILYTANNLICATTNIKGEYTILSGNNNGIIINVININSIAFGNCVDLESIILPLTLINIQENPFVNCIKLTNISTNNPSSYFYIHNSNNGDILYAGDRVICATTNITGEYTILSNILNININQIDGFAFSNCINLESIILPSSLTNIGENPFANCEKLTNISTNIVRNTQNTLYFYIHNSNNGDILYTYNRLICATANITGIYTILSQINVNNIDVEVININDYAFSNCKFIKSLNIPESINSIGNFVGGTFFNCTSLETILFYGNSPNVVKKIFENNKALEVIYYLLENQSSWIPRPWWIPDGVLLLPFLPPEPITEYKNKTIMYTTPKSLNFIILQNNNIYKLQKNFNMINTSRNYINTINNVNLHVISQIFNK